MGRGRPTAGTRPPPPSPHGSAAAPPTAPAATTPPLPAASVAALSRQAARTHRKFFMKILTMEPSMKRGRCRAARGAPAVPGSEAPALRSSRTASAAAILGPRSARAARLRHGGTGGAHRRAQPPRGLPLVRSAPGGFLLAGREGGGTREGGPAHPRGTRAPLVLPQDGGTAGRPRGGFVRRCPQHRLWRWGSAGSREAAGGWRRNETK